MNFRFSQLDIFNVSRIDFPSPKSSSLIAVLLDISNVLTVLIFPNSNVSIWTSAKSKTSNPSASVKSSDFKLSAFLILTVFKFLQLIILNNSKSFTLLTVIDFNFWQFSSLTSLNAGLLAIFKSVIPWLLSMLTLVYLEQSFIWTVFKDCKLA